MYIELQPSLRVQRFDQRRLRVLPVRLVRDLRRDEAPHRVAQREDLAGADALARRAEQVIVEQRRGRRRGGRRRTGGEQHARQQRQGAAHRTPPSSDQHAHCAAHAGGNSGAGARI
jgi:hypothetical protein